MTDIKRATEEYLHFSCCWCHSRVGLKTVRKHALPARTEGPDSKYFSLLNVFRYFIKNCEQNKLLNPQIFILIFNDMLMVSNFLKMS